MLPCSATLTVCLNPETFLQFADSTVPLLVWSSILLARSVRRRKNVDGAASPVAVSVFRVTPLRHLPAWREVCISKIGHLRPDRPPMIPLYPDLTAVPVLTTVRCILS